MKWQRIIYSREKGGCVCVRAMSDVSSCILLESAQYLPVKPRTLMRFAHVRRMSDYVRLSEAELALIASTNAIYGQCIREGVHCPANKTCRASDVR